MSSICEGGYVRFNPDLNDSYDMENEEEVYVPSKYPFSIPKIYLKGFKEDYYPQVLFSWCTDSVIVTNDKILTRYTTSDYFELLAEDENGKTMWVDGRTAPYEGCWKGKYLGEHRRAQEIVVEEFNLETLEKKKYKVTEESTSPMDMRDFYGLEDYIDPNIIKRINKKDIPAPANDPDAPF